MAISYTFIPVLIVTTEGLDPVHEIIGRSRGLAGSLLAPRESSGEHSFLSLSFKFLGASSLDAERCQGIIFVADARPRGLEFGLEKYEELEDVFRAKGRNLYDLPRVILVDNSDAIDAIDPAVIAELIDPEAPHIAGVTGRGIGSREAMAIVLKSFTEGRAVLPEPRRRTQIAACDQRWDILEGEGPLLRRCRRCRREVRRVSLPWQAQSEVRAGRCIATDDPNLLDPSRFELRAQRLPRIGPWPCFIEHGFAV